VRLVSRADDADVSFDEELEVAKQLAGTEPLASRRDLERLLRTSDPELADALIQPVEYSYTVASLDQLVTSCGLELTLPCYNVPRDPLMRSSTPRMVTARWAMCCAHSASIRRIARRSPISGCTRRLRSARI
jgi:hypothetical protein